MTGNDRRKEVRIEVRFPCELVFGGERTSGTVLDLSPGGLSVAADRSVEQGDEVFVRLHPKGRSSVDIEALVWNVRGIGRRANRKASIRLGLVLSEAPDEYLGLLKSKGPPRGAEAPRSAEPCSPEPASEAGSPAPARRFRARVKQSATTRTRVILVFAESAEDAAEKARAEVGRGWSLLEVA